MTVQPKGTDFVPANPIEVIATYQNRLTLLSCCQTCNLNPLCRTFVSDTNSPFTCRLYQGSIETGTVISSLSLTSQVGGIHYSSSLYTTYNQPCPSKSSVSDRYLICNNGLWQCPKDTFWNGSICLNEVYYQASCNTDLECREDIYLSCSSSCKMCSCQPTAIWNWSSLACVTSKCAQLIPTDPDLVALLTLNGNTQDSMNNYDGTIAGSLSFVIGYVGQAMKFDGAGYIMLPHIDFYLRSFTIELWIYLTNVTILNFPLFGECPSVVDNQCLHIREIDNNTQLRMGFWNDSIDTTTALYYFQWYHLAFVYDYNSRTRSIYLNGKSQSVIAVNPTASHLYLGQSGNVTIGKIEIFHATFIGYIDHVSITHRAKAQDEIVDDATLVAYYSFDCGSTYDSGPNLLHANAAAIVIIRGQINEAFQFNSSAACFQTPGLTALGITNQSFSFSFWIKPMQVLSTLIHLSTSSHGNGWCSTILGFSASGNMIAQVSGATLTGPTFPLNVWTHVVYTYSVTNGIHLYTNGTSSGSSGGNVGRDGANMPVYLTVANRLSAGISCSLGTISSGAFSGAIDELRIYSRELSSSEICMLSLS